MGWTELKRWLHAQTEHPTLGSFARFHGALLDAEFAAGPLPDHRGNGAVEKVLQDVKKRVGKREFCFRNSTRTNRWLELVRATLNRQDDVHAYARAIRDHLDTPGRTRMPHQLAIADRAGLPSLR